MNDLDIKFTDSLQVEESFYQAFRTRDINLMKDIWDKTDEVICIHPGSPRIYSFDLIIASWEQIFLVHSETMIDIDDQVYKLQEDVSIHYVKETLSVGDESVASVYATNIYHQTSGGWKMIAHHASPAFTASEKKRNPSLH
ncbi:MAG: nuclear transport factor 2 family protein [Gammaproteobacteria bacterium]|nr:nuclear transport factor 2 family protein [Gammaproteobacteria bacterium]